jgi:hypothetical protein
MKYMLLMNYSDTPGVPPMTEWAPEDMKARGQAMMAIHEELTASGELVGTEGLTGPEAAKIVTDDGTGAPVVTDGPFAESKEFVGGFCLLECANADEALEWAHKVPLSSGAIEIRPVMDLSRFGYQSRTLTPVNAAA